LNSSLVEHLVFFLEEPSAQDFLQSVLPRILPPNITPHYLVFEGKQDLEKRLVTRMKHWLKPNSQFIVMRDQDSGNCTVIKENLKRLCKQAGKPRAIVRIVCKELETFFVGDWAAVAAAYDRPALTVHARSAKYRDPDLLGSPSFELKRLIPSYQKRAGARAISPHLNFERNASHSFRVLMQSIQLLNTE
jgi:Domain of unknown function (DUF4276)